MRAGIVYSVTALLLLALAAPAAAGSQNCDPEANDWVPGRYYGTGARVFFKGDWYASRERNEGHRPGTGEFAWRRLDSAPECQGAEVNDSVANKSADHTVKATHPGDEASATPFPQAGNTTSDKEIPATPDRRSATTRTIGASQNVPEKSGHQRPEKDCRSTSSWNYNGSYHVGQRVTYEGHVYEAVRPTDGDMPGVSQSSRWKRIGENCNYDRE